MIQARELRIGNKVISKTHNILNATIEGFTPGGLVFLKEVSASMDQLDKLEPIPLTPDILEKAGFVLQPQRISIYINGRLKLWLGHNGTIAYLKNEDTDESYYIPKNPQSLHQLQNLYFALTGEELEIMM